MANNFIANAITFGSEDVGGVQHEKVKVTGTTNANAGLLAPTTSTTTITLAANANRYSVAFQNTGTVDVRVHKTSGFTLNTGWLIQPGQGFSSNYTGAFYLATASGTGAVNYWEDVNG